MKSSSILRSLSLRIPMRLSASSSAVVPLQTRTPFDQQLRAELDALQNSSTVSDQSDEYTTLLLNALKASKSAQKITLDSLQNVVFDESDRKIFDQYLDFNIRMLDTCNELTEKTEIIQKYVESLRVVSHLLERNGGRHPATLARVGDALDSCKEMEKRSNDMGNCGSAAGLRKMFRQKSDQCHWQDSRLGEILSGSMAITSTVCAILGNALSFKSKRGLPVPLLQVHSSVNNCSWSCSLQQLQKQVKEQKKSGSGAGAIMELQQMVKAGRSLKDQIKQQNEIRFDNEELKRSCGKMEEGIKELEGRVKELYKSLISVRMALLGILSRI